MLNHEEQTPAAQIPAAERIAGVAPIGQVVDELGLDSTPEEIWAQGEKQRAEKSVPKPQVQVVPVTQNKKLRRRVMRGWHGVSWWIWVIFWCSGGLGLFAGLPHLLHPNVGIDVSGDRVTSSYNVQGTGPQRDVSVSGDHDKITLYGNVRNLSVDGHGNTVTVTGSVEAVSVDDDNNTIHWTKELPGKAVQPEVSGNGNIVGQSAP